MTNYLRGNAEKNKKRNETITKILLVIFGISFGLLIDEKLAIRATSSDIEISVVSATKSKKELAREVVSLQQQRQVAKILEEQYLEATKQIKRLEASLGRLGENKNIVLAAVNTRFSGFDSVRVDQGEMSGIKVGNPVYRSGSLIGEIVSVRRDGAQVAKLSRSGREISGILPSGGHITLFGKGGDTFYSSIHRDVEIKKGDVIQGLFFEEPILATVVSVEKNAQDPFQKVVSSASEGLSRGLYVEIDRSSDIRDARPSPPALLRQVVIPEQENPRDIEIIEVETEEEPEV